MTRKYTSHKSSLFLLELILAILFFSIASAICVQLFVKSHTLSTDAQNLSIAVNECADTAEIIYSSNTPEEMFNRLKNAYPNLQMEGSTLFIPYDETFQKKIVYEMVDQADHSTILHADISFADVYSLNITHRMEAAETMEVSYE